MKLTVKNLGVVKNAEIEFPGITVLSGVNGTGKSTMGKALYCCGRVFYNKKENIRNEYISQMSSTIYKLPYENSSSLTLDVNAIDKIIASYGLSEDIELPEGMIGTRNDKLKAEIDSKLKKILKVDPAMVLASIIKRTMDTEFGEQQAPVNHPERQINLILELDEERKIDIKRSNSEIPEVIESADINQGVVYLDDPYLLDYMSNQSQIPYGRFSHQWDTVNRLQYESDKSSVIHAILAENAWKQLESLIDEMCDGELLQRQGRISYSSEKLKSEIGLEGISTGMKSILLLKTLLKNGSTDGMSFFIFDEPEVHLHPEWQFKLAQVLVLLPQVFDMQVLISTHSADFLSALDYYTNEYKMKERTRFYQMEMDKEGYSFSRDVTGEIDRIYNSLSSPFLRVAGQL